MLVGVVRVVNCAILASCACIVVFVDYLPCLLV